MWLGAKRRQSGNRAVGVGSVAIRRWAKSGGRLVLELVVFLGVYLAFLFTDFQEGRKDRAVQIK